MSGAMEWEMCCGNVCDKITLSKQLRVKGASEFLEFINVNCNGDTSEAALDELLLLFVDTV